MDASVSSNWLGKTESTYSMEITGCRLKMEMECNELNILFDIWQHHSCYPEHAQAFSDPNQAVVVPQVLLVQLPSGTWKDFVELVSKRAVSAV